MLDVEQNFLFPPDNRGKGMSKGQPTQVIVGGVYYTVRKKPILQADSTPQLIKFPDLLTIISIT